MTSRSPIPFLVAAAAIASAVIVAACDDSNRPIRSPSTPDPAMRPGDGSDGGGGEGGASPSPTITAAPGDIHI